MSNFGDSFCLTLVTDDPVLAAAADAGGVDRIGIDIERLHKVDRQPGPLSRISQHVWDDLERVAQVVRRAEIFVRLNPLHDGTAGEIDTALALGAQVLMLPFFNSAAEPRQFLQMLDGRAYPVLLLETASAVAQLPEILELSNTQEIMLGLNDLHLQLGMTSPFDVLTSPMVDDIAAQVHASCLRLSAGGVARVDDCSLPVPPDLVHGQYPRLGATGAWLARSFSRDMPAGCTLASAVQELRQNLDLWATRSAADLEQVRQALQDHAFV